MPSFEVRSCPETAGAMAEWNARQTGTIGPFVKELGQQSKPMLCGANNPETALGNRWLNDDAHRLLAPKAGYETGHWRNTVEPKKYRLVDVKNTALLIVKMPQGSPLS